MAEYESPVTTPQQRFKLLSAPFWSGSFTFLGYLLAAAIIYIGWRLRNQHLISASYGIGYWFGITGATLMVLLLLYPLRKRAKFMRNAGPIKHWFRAHMMMGIIGPLLVLLHSNFNLGSTNSRVALFCTIVVSTSGILGRYLYSKIHYGMYGQRITFDSIRVDIESTRNSSSLLKSITPIFDRHLVPQEDLIAAAPNTVFASLVQALRTTLSASVVKFRLKRDLRHTIDQLATTSSVIANNKLRLLRSSLNYANYRVSVLRRFAQIHACERLFSLWHIVHYPLFMVLVVAAVIHVVAVHMY